MLPRNVPPILCCVLGCLLLPQILPAQQNEGPIGTHVVRPGETLRGLAEFYLGSADRWPEIWELNDDEIADPDRIYPGFKLKFRTPEQLPSRAARVARFRRHVEEQRSPHPVERVEVNDLLAPLDVIETYEGASAELEFGDDTNLVVTEQSRIVLGGQARARSTVDRQQIEIVMGQADLESSNDTSGFEIEIVMGDTVVRPQPEEPGKTVKTRTRRPEGQGAQLMVYEGKSGIEAGGEQLEVPQGMGTTVAEGEPPAPPEKLLEGPELIQPESGARVGESEPLFSWKPVDGAVSYTLEVCLDERCGELERRVTDLDDVSWQAEGLPLASYFWRVTARSPSGLDGFPSSPTPFALVLAPQDQVAPLAALRYSGPMVGVNQDLVLGVGAEIRAEVTDEGSGLAEWSRLLDDGVTTEEGWKSTSWSSGRHTATVVAVDREGNRTRIDEPFVYDPDPPVISWGFEDGETLGEASGPSDSEIDPLLAKKDFGLWSRTTGSNLSPLVWTSSKIKWLPMEFGDWLIKSDKPFIILRSRKKRGVSLTTIDENVTRDRGIWVHATDAGCGVESMSYQLLLGPEKQLVLVFEALDALDNKTRVVWQLSRN